METHRKSNVPLNGSKIIVAGGTGNVGGFIVRSLLAAGASVAVPSRSDEKIDDLRDYLATSLGPDDLSRLYTIRGDVTAENGARDLLSRFNEEWGTPNAAVASLGRWHGVPSLLEASAEDLQRPLDDYLLAHFKVARALLPGLKEHGGTYISINGPLAFEIWPDIKGELVSIATAAQHMLFRALSEELKQSPARAVELVTYAFLRNRQTQPESPITGDAVGDYVVYLLSEAAEAVHGRTIHLKSADQLLEIGLPAES